MTLGFRLSADTRIARRVLFDYELIFIEYGEGTLTFYNPDADNARAEEIVGYKTGDFLFIRPGEPHSFHFETKTCQPHLHFDLFEDELSEKLAISFKDSAQMTPGELELIRPDSLAGYPIPHLIKPGDDDRLECALMKCVKATRAGGLSQALCAKALLTEIVSLLVSYYGESDEFVRSDSMLKVKRYIDEYYQSDIPRPALTLDSIAAEFAMSRFTMLHSFSRRFGVPVMKYVSDVKLRRADDLLASRKSITITEIAALLGYDSIYSFSRFYKNKAGMSPSARRID